MLHQHTLEETAEAFGPCPECSGVSSDLDIYRSAAGIIRGHGEDAAIEAARRADEMLNKGDIDGQRAWLRILAAVQELQRTERPEGVTVN